MFGEPIRDLAPFRWDLSGTRRGSPSGSCARLWDVIEATMRAATLTDLPALAAIDDSALPDPSVGTNSITSSPARGAGSWCLRFPTVTRNR